MIKVGVIGCGQISEAYFKGCKTFDIIEVIACADLNEAAARAKAKEHGIPRCYSVDELLADEDVDLVVNLTIPKAHASVNRAAIRAGKHVFTEKPFSLTRDEGLEVLEEANAAGVLIGSAPDTLLGAPIQTCRALVDAGEIGEPVAAVAFMAGHGPESWHANPGFFYEKGGGPMFDMGPYYFTALVNLLGPMARVSGSTRITFPERVATSPACNGRRIPVATPTHLTGTIDFRSKAIATVIMSFDVWAHQLPRLEIYGSEGSLAVPDPNRVDGLPLLRRAGETEWREMPLTHTVNSHRGIGVADLALAMLKGAQPRASGELALHVVDAMQAFEESSDSERHIRLSTACEKPAPLPHNLPAGKLEA